MLSTRVLLPPVGHIADGNAHLRHPAERGSWIWHPEKSTHETAVLRFRLRFTLEAAASPLVHVTADQRFQLRCDGHDVTFGPDRCDVEHWTVQTVRLELDPGEHEFEALAWYIGEPEDLGMRPAPLPGEPLKVVPPMAQITCRAGFLLYAEGVPTPLLNTGEAAWAVEDITGAVAMERPFFPFYHDVGPGFTYDMNRWPVRDSVRPRVVLPPSRPNRHGVRRPGWCLYPAEIPEQRRAPWTGGKIRAVRSGWEETQFRQEETRDPGVAAWQGLLDASAPVVVPPRSKFTILWDLDIYRCGYPAAKVAGGEGAVIEWDWAEALYEETSGDKVHGFSGKGHRGEIVNKVFFGAGDHWRVGSGGEMTTPSLWWRCGRYVRLRVATADAPLTLRHLGLITTGYPLERTAEWRSSDEVWDSLMPFFENAFVCSAHETWTDSPYYEQMCYVGDNVLNTLSNYALFRDARLSRRSVQLFEWSRRPSGLVAERYPSSWRQESCTFSLLWPAMVRDYAWWRDDAPFVKSMLPGIRSVLAEFEAFAGEDGLLKQAPGWPFTDWVPDWDKGKDVTVTEGCPPGIYEADSSILNLFWTLALIAASQVEEAFGDPLMAGRYRQLAERVFDAVVSTYWDDARGIFRDTSGGDSASEHAQMFALLTGLLDAQKTASCLAALRNDSGALTRATISASFYLLDALCRHGEEAEFHRRLEFWRGLPAMGFTSTPETPEPTRSDAHVWGAHPAWHTLASIAGVRPAAAGFNRVRIAPLPGPLDHFEAKVVHPRGIVAVSYRTSKEGRAGFTVELPPGITGAFVFRGKTSELKPGLNSIDFPV